MNERIKELAVKSGFELEDSGHLMLHHLYVTNRLEKFAELIVRNCIDVAIHKDDGMISTADIAGYMAAGRANAAKMIAKHFGVEE